MARSPVVEGERPSQAWAAQTKRGVAAHDGLAWEASSRPLDALGADEVLMVWRPLASSPAELAALRETLDPTERAAAARFVFARDQDRSIVSRGTLRTLLGAMLGRAPASIALVSGAHGKPALRDRELEFNVSHADEHLLIGLSRGRELGVDVEGGDHPLDADELAPVVFTAAERRALGGYAVSDRRQAFLRGWTRKEAYLKARAVGLSMPLTDFSVSLDDDWAARLSSEVDPAEAARFVLVGAPAPAGYAAAACWAKQGPQVRQLRTAILPLHGVG